MTVTLGLIAFGIVLVNITELLSYGQLFFNSNLVFVFLIVLKMD